MEIPATQYSLSKSWKRKPGWRAYTFELQKLLQSYSNQDSVAPAERQTYLSMEQNWESRDKPTHIWWLNFWQGCQANWKWKEYYQEMLLGHLDIHMQKNEFQLLLHPVDKN